MMEAMSTATAAPTRHPVPWTAVRIDDPFWSPRLRALIDVTLPSQYQQLHDSGRLASLGIWDGPGEAPPSHRFHTSDIAKWLEAVAYAQAWAPDVELRAKAERVIAGYAAIQGDDGYCNQGFDNPAERWTDLRDGHELYSAGHLIEAAVAWHAIGDDALLRVVLKLAELIWRRFGPDGAPGYPGHPETELALVRLADSSGDDRWRQLAQLMVDRRGQQPGSFAAEDERNGKRAPDTGYDYYQAHAPVREQLTVEGHSVRALYLLAGVEDLAQRGGDAELRAAADAQWANAIERRMYVTGGFGSHHDGERFTADFDLPEREAYTETCAAIAGAMVARRRLSARRDAASGDVLERCLHNGMLAGFGLDGCSYHYANPLRVQPGIDPKHKRWCGCGSSVARQPWYGCACCPPNVARVLASLGGWAYDLDPQGLDCHLLLGGELDHGGWRLRIDADQVGAGRGGIHVATAPAGEQELRIRLPLWRGATALELDGAAVSWVERDGYAVIARCWSGGEVLRWDFAPAPLRLHADPRICDAAGKVAIQRGPLLYCAEQVDHAAPLACLRLGPGELVTGELDLLPGCVALEGAGQALRADALYATEPPRAVTARIRLVPYPLWGNREPGAMQVWLPLAR